MVAAVSHRIIPDGVVIKTVRPREQSLLQTVSFTSDDAFDCGRFSVKNNTWYMVCDNGKPQTNGIVESVVAISSPDGRVAVWFGTFGAWNGRGHAPNTASAVRLLNERRNVRYDAAVAATRCAALAAQWNPRWCKGGKRDVTALAQAAGRVLHAEAFDYAPTQRDRYLAELTALTALKGSARPPTDQILRADLDMLAAACALTTIHSYAAARLLLAGKGASAVKGKAR